MPSFVSGNAEAPGTCPKELYGTATMVAGMTDLLWEIANIAKLIEGAAASR